jgi:hypothetical protein
MRLLFAAALLYAASRALAASNASTIIFQGFRYGWQRKFLGFETPHRLGSIAAYVDDSSLFVCRFTPGVDGDFAHPTLFYAVLAKEAPFPAQSGLWRRVARDRAGGSTEHPFAETLLRDRIVVLRPAESYGDESGAAAIINGFNVSMLCNSSCGTCNSNGVWPYSFNMSISNCSFHGTNVECEISFGLGRGWTPTHGGGKSFNACMAFDISIYFIVFVYKRSAVSTLLSDPIEKLGWLADGVTTATRSFEAPPGSSPLFTGISSFGWELLETDGLVDRGRYLESYHFSLTQPRMSSDSKFAYNVSLGLSDPSLTTVPSRARYHVDALTLLAPSDPLPMATLQAVATVCKDDPGTEFYCSDLDLNASLIDTVPLQLN